MRQRRLQSGGIAARRVLLVFSSSRLFQFRPLQLHDIECATLERGLPNRPRKGRFNQDEPPAALRTTGNVDDRILKRGVTEHSPNPYVSASDPVLRRVSSPRIKTSTAAMQVAA